MANMDDINALSKFEIWKWCLGPFKTVLISFLLQSIIFDQYMYVSMKNQNKSYEQ